MPNYLIEKIIVCDDFNVRAKELLQAKIAEYMEIFPALPSVSVFMVGGKPYLVDGWHRLRAAEGLGLTTLKVTIAGKGTLLQAQDQADAVNLRHGIMLTQD